MSAQMIGGGGYRRRDRELTQSRCGAPFVDRRRAVPLLRCDHVDDLANQVSQLVTIFVTSLDALTETDFEDTNARKQDAVLEEKQSKKVLHMAIAGLPPEDKELLRLYYFEDLSLEEVGNRIGLSKSWTCRRHSQVIQKLTSQFKQLTEVKQKPPPQKPVLPRVRAPATATS